VASLSGLLVIPLLLHHLGVAAFGIWSLVTTTTSYLNLSSLGIGNVTTKLVAEDAGRDREAVIRVVNTNLCALCGLAVVAAAIGIGISIAAPEIFRIPRGYETDTVISFAIVAVGLAVSLPVGLSFGVLTGFQRYDLIGLCNATTVGAVGLASVAVVLSGGGLIPLALATTLVGLASGVLPTALAVRLIPGIRISPKLVDRRSIRRTASLSVWYLIQNLASVIGLDIDLVVVGIIIGVKGVALYAIGAKIGQIADRGVGPLQQVFFPHVSAVSMEKDARVQIAAVLIDGTRTVMAVALPLGLILAILAQPGIQAWVGPGYGVSAQVVAVFGGIAIFGSLTTASWQILGGMGRARLAALVGLTDALVNLGISIGLAKPLGPPGVALGTMISIAVINVPVILWVTTRLVGVPFKRLLRRAVLPHALPAAVTSGALLLLEPTLHGSVAAVLGCAAGAFLLYEGVFILWGAVPAERSRLLGSLPGPLQRLIRHHVSR